MIQGINHITFSVRDLDRALSFYCDVLDLRLVARWRRGAYLSAGTLWLSLVLVPDRENCPQDDHSHVAFTIDGANFGTLSERILDSGAAVWRENGQRLSLYFEDPDGHKLEIHPADFSAQLALARAARWDGLEIHE